MRSQTARFVARSRVLAARAAIAAPSAAGELDPPPGAVAPTDTALRQTDPRTPIDQSTAPATPTANHRISTSGSYFLTSDIAAEQNKSAIEIAAPYVTIDLNGFDIAGATLFTTDSVDGIRRVGGTLAGSVAITNGVIHDFDQTGVRLPDDAVRLADLTILQSGADNAFLGADAVVTRCQFLQSVSGDGLFVGEGSAVSGCVANGNADSGLVIDDGSTVVNCSARANGQTGVQGSTGVLIQSCSATANGRDGIAIANGSVLGCVSRLNGSHGIATRTINTSSSAFNALIRSNRCEDNGQTLADGAGIHAIGNFIVIDGNMVIGNDVGIREPGNDDGSLIIRNFAFDNSGLAYDIAPGNAFGPVIDTTGVGNLVGVTNGAHPWANFSR